MGEVLQNATPRSPAARRFGANSSTTVRRNLQLRVERVKHPRIAGYRLQAVGFRPRLAATAPCRPPIWPPLVLTRKFNGVIRQCATSKNSEGCAKRERRHAPRASHRAQARRTRPSSSLPAPKQCSGNAPRAQVKVNSTGAPDGRLDQESRDHIPLGHLERMQFSLQRVCNEVCQARAQER